MGDPVGIAGYAREHLADGGTVLLVEPFALDGRAENIAENPMAAAALHGVVVRSARRTRCRRRWASASAPRPARRGSRQVFEEAGFTHFRRAAETPMNLILEAKR